jgi:hypothetical protein
MAPLMQPLASAGAVTTRNENAATAHAKLLAMSFSEAPMLGGLTTQLANKSSLAVWMAVRRSVQPRIKGTFCSLLGGFPPRGFP